MQSRVDIAKLNRERIDFLAEQIEEAAAAVRRGHTHHSMSWLPFQYQRR
jgi:hypothetical protein